MYRSEFGPHMGARVQAVAREIRESAERTGHAEAVVVAGSDDGGRLAEAYVEALGLEGAVQVATVVAGATKDGVLENLLELFVRGPEPARVVEGWAQRERDKTRAMSAHAGDALETLRARRAR